MTNYTVGIDLGTTNTVCCSFRDSFEFIHMKRGYVLPSVLMYKDGKITVGDAAKQRAVRNPESTISSSKTYMGDYEKFWEIEDKQFSPTDVAAEILKEVKLSVQKQFDTDEEISAVITVPAYFTASQYDETKKAAEAAGLNVIRIISEPVAAAVAYGIDDSVHSIFVVDIGGGTFDICLLETSVKSGEKVFTTKCVDGDTRLGGDDFDGVVENICFSHLRKEYGIDFSSLESSGLDADAYGQALQKIRQKSEQAKIVLSDSEEANIDIANLCEKNGDSLNFRLVVSRDEFEKNAAPLFNKIRRIINRCIEDNDIQTESIDKVVFVGGSANIPYIKQIISDCFGQEPFADKDLSKLVSMGAALCAAQNDSLVSTKIVLGDIISHSLGIEIDVSKDGKHYCYAPVIPKGTPYPISQSQTFYTLKNNQKSVGINVFEGESLENLSDNNFYGGFELTNIKRGPAGIPILVNFDINEDRQLVVTAQDVETDAKKSITIKKGDKPISYEEECETIQRELRISVTEKRFDDIGSILSSLGIAYSAFSDIEYDCDILFINCGTRDYINADKLREYVENGGCVYASCFADIAIKKAFPGILETDHFGRGLDENVSVLDPELSAVAGESIGIKYDRDRWVRIHSARNCTTILRSNLGERLPIMLSLQYGRGMIFYTSFHNHVQTSEKEKALLQLLVIRQISLNSHMTLSEAGKALGVDISQIKEKFK